MHESHLHAAELSADASVALAEGRKLEAFELYSKAAAFERAAFDETPVEKRRTRCILAVSFVSLLYKGRQYGEAELEIRSLLASQELLPWAEAQLRELLEAMAGERLVKEGHPEAAHFEWSDSESPFPNASARKSMVGIKSILLVTSEPDPSFQSFLTDLADIQISLTTEASELTKVDLVIVDDQPGTAEIVAKYRDRYPKLPIVALSSGLSWESARESWRAGATDVVRKQPDDAELSQAVKRIFGLSGQSICFVNESTEFLEAWARLLREEGFSVATASSSAEALYALANQRFGLAVVDVRLKSNSERTSGLRVAEVASQKGIKTFILTARPDFRIVRSEMADDQAGIVEFVYKEEGFSNFLDRLNAFTMAGH